MTNEELCSKIKSGNDTDGKLLLQLLKQCNDFIYQQAIRWSSAFSSRPDVDIEDLTQSAFFAVLEAVERFRPGEGNFITLLKITLKKAFSEALGIRTSKGIREPLNKASSLDLAGTEEGNDSIADLIQDERSEEAFESVEAQIMQEQLHEILLKALKTIPEKESIAVQGVYFEGVTQAEIACRIGASGSYAGQLLSRGIKHLRKCSMIEDLSEAFYGERNVYRHTGFQSWNATGCSQPEYFVERKESTTERMKKLIIDKGLSLEEAKSIVFGV